MKRQAQASIVFWENGQIVELLGKEMRHYGEIVWKII